MSIVIAVAGTKGGVGRTTLTASLAVEAAKKSPRVAIYDSDPQKSITMFMAARQRQHKNPTMSRGADTVTDAVESLRLAGYDWIFLDGLPGSLIVTEEMIDQADFVVIPIKPSSIDLLANLDAVEVAIEKKRPYVVTINQASSADGRLVRYAKGTLFTRHIAIANTVVVNRDAHPDAMARGRVGSEIDRKAADEIAALWTEIKSAAEKAVRAQRRERA